MQDKNQNVMNKTDDQDRFIAVRSRRLETEAIEDYVTGQL